MFLTDFLDKARANPKKIAYSEAELDDRILLAALEVKSKGIARPVLIGSRSKIQERAQTVKKEIKDIEIIEPKNHPQFDNYADKLYQMRKNKGLSKEAATNLIKNPSYFATMLVKEGVVDGLVAGVSSITKPLKPALQIIGTYNKNTRVSGVFLMFIGNRLLFFADCAMNINPNSKELAQIALDTALTAKSMGIKPKVAMLSFSTNGSAKNEMVDKVRNATNIAKSSAKDVTIEGEMQLDCALVKEVCEKKFPNSKIKGDANVLIFPDLNSGNIGYKLVERLAKATAVGPILQGLSKPVNDLSRGCSVQDIVYVTALTVLQSGELL